MAKPFKSILIKLLDKAGIAQNSPEALELLGKIDVTVEDAAYGTFEKFLDDAMTLDIAKKHPDVLAHYNHTILSGVDAKIKQLATAADFTPEELVALDAEPKSMKKMDLFQKMAKEKLEKEYADLKAGDKGKLAEEIKKLNGDIVSVRESSKLEVEAAKKEIDAARVQAETEISNYAYESLLGSKQYANSDIPAEVNVMTAKNLLNTELAKRGAALVRKDGKLTLVNAKNPDLEFIENNKVVNFGEFADSTLAANKLLKVSEAAPAGQQQQRKQQQSQSDGTKSVDVSSVSAELRADAAKLRAEA